MTAHPIPARVRLLATALLVGAACTQGAAAASTRPAPVVAATAPATPPPMHLVQTPRGLMRVVDATAPPPGARGTAAPAATHDALAAPSSAMPMHVVGANGGSMRVMGAAAPRAALAAPVATSKAPRVTLRTAANGAVMRALPTPPAASTPAAASRVAIVDIDPAGRTLNPADARRKDVLFRRVDRLPAH